MPSMIFDLLVCLECGTAGDAYCAPMTRSVPVLLLLLAGAGIAAAAPECLPNCRGADLSGANLVGANLVGADLTGARLDGATLFGADLTGANLVPRISDGRDPVRCYAERSGPERRKPSGRDPVWHASAKREPKRRGT